LEKVTEFYLGALLMRFQGRLKNRIRNPANGGTPMENRWFLYDLARQHQKELMQEAEVVRQVSKLAKTQKRSGIIKSLLTFVTS
jgi:hypothetical protein